MTAAIKVCRWSVSRSVGVTVQLAGVTASARADAYRPNAVERATRAALAAWAAEARAARVDVPDGVLVEVDAERAGAHDARPAEDVARAWFGGGR